MTIQSLMDPEIQELLKDTAHFFRKAEKSIKMVEQLGGELLFPPVNELRYAGFHLTEALETLSLRVSRQKTEDLETVKEELRKAKRHCQRSLFDSVEMSLYFLLESIQIFEDDYRLVSLSDSIPKYIENRAFAREVRYFLEDLKQKRNRGKREKFSEKAEDYYKKLFRIHEELQAARPELNKKIFSRVLALIATVVGVISGIVGIFLGFFG